MAQIFSLAEVVKVGVEDERSGVAFYGVLAEKASDPALRETFAGLAEEERGHAQRFEKMLRDVGDVHVPEQYAGEHGAYLQALTSSRAFPDEQTAKAMARDCGDDVAALDLAIRFERDTLALMHEMQQMVPERDAAAVNELIHEEQGHLVVLASAKDKLTGKSA
jgi:rubrerythrin